MYDENCTPLARPKPVTVMAYFMQCFDSIFDCNDTNVEGLANVSKSSKSIAVDGLVAG